MHILLLVLVVIVWAEDQLLESPLKCILRQLGAFNFKICSQKSGTHLTQFPIIFNLSHARVTQSVSGAHNPNVQTIPIDGA